MQRIVPAHNIWYIPSYILCACIHVYISYVRVHVRAYVPRFYTSTVIIVITHLSTGNKVSRLRFSKSNSNPINLSVLTKKSQKVQGVFIPGTVILRNNYFTLQHPTTPVSFELWLIRAANVSVDELLSCQCKLYKTTSTFLLLDTCRYQLSHGNSLALKELNTYTYIHMHQYRYINIPNNIYIYIMLHMLPFSHFHTP